MNLPGGALITNKFDAVARLLSTTLRNSSGSTLNAHSYVYDLAGQRTWLTNTAGDYRNYLYDNIGQLQGAHANESGGTPRAQEQFGYAYDPAGNLLWHTNNTLTQSIAVNSLNELQTLTNAGTLTVAGTTTSAATNVTVWGTGLSSAQAAIYASDNSWARTNVSLPNGNATFNASAQDNLGRTDTNSVNVTLPNALAFQYEGNGNLTNDGYRSFAYDDENQLISVVVTNGPGPSTRSDFAYDGLMRRRLRTEMSWNGSNWSTNQIVRYVYDGSLVIQERDGNNIPLVTYTRGRDLSGSLQGAGGIGGLLARTDMGLLTVAMPSAHAYYHADGNGNITCLINTNQSIVAKYLYDPFGVLIDKSGQLADANHIGFSSKEFHSNSGLYYYGFRFYDPLFQRWLNRDPIGEQGGINLYRFVGNSPINNVDPFGLTDSVPYVVYPDSFIGPLPPGGVHESYDRFRQQAEGNGLQPSLLGEVLLPGGGLFMSGGASRCGAKALAEVAARRSAAIQEALQAALKARDSAGTALSVAMDARKAALQAVRAADASSEFAAQQFGKDSFQYFEATQAALEAEVNFYKAADTVFKAAENFRIADQAAKNVRW